MTRTADYSACGLCDATSTDDCNYCRPEDKERLQAKAKTMSQIPTIPACPACTKPTDDPDGSLCKECRALVAQMLAGTGLRQTECSMSVCRQLFFELGKASARRILIAIDLEFPGGTTDEQRSAVMSAWCEGYFSACGMSAEQAHATLARFVTADLQSLRTKTPSC